VLYDDLEVWDEERGGGGGLRRRVHIYSYGCFMLMYGRNH